MRTTYDVFARKEHAEPLIYIGSVEADSDEAVAQASLAAYGQAEWVEMLSVPHHEIIVVFSPDKEQEQ